MKQQSLLGMAERNQLYCGDCLNVLDIIPNDSIDLIYIDPPFYSQRSYEMIWGEEAERFAFEDRWQGGINHYLNYLLTRIRKMYAKLKGTGSFYIHLDWHISHYMKLELDKLFGYHNFRNEIFWKRDAAGKGAKTISRQWPRIADTLLFYSKSDSWFFEQQFTAPTQLQIKEYHYRDPNGRQLKRTTLGDYTQKSISEMEAKGLIYTSRTGKKYKKYYFDEAKVTVDSMWTDIFGFGVVTSSKERTGYPTQKPVALLERIVSASSRPGDLVLDAYCGCGTTLAAAQKLERRWIGIDISQSAIRVVEQRMQKLGATNFDVHGLVGSLAELRALDPFEFQNWAINAVYGQHSPRKIADMGIDGFTFMEHHPIQVKQIDHVGRPVIDNFSGVLQREKEKKGMVIAFGFTSGAVDEVARLERQDKIKIELVSCADLIAGNVSFRVIA